MKTIFKMLSIVLIVTILFSCEKSTSDLAIDSISVYITEDWGTDINPVCLKMNISSDERFDYTYLLKQDVTIEDDKILIEIRNIKNQGTCEYPDYYSAPEPENYQCPARTDYFILDNLQRGSYSIEIRLLDNLFSGQLELQDQSASLIFNEGNVSLNDTVLHIMPDSTIFGTYYSRNTGSEGFQDMLNELLSANCKAVAMEPGQYKAFEIDSLGRILIGSSQDDSQSAFILKYDLDIERILSILNDFIAGSDDAYKIIFKDNLGNYYNITDLTI